MARKKEVIGRVTKRDGEMMKCVANTGVITKQNAKECFNLNDKRLKLLEKNKYIESVNVKTPNGVETIYKLSAAGREFINNDTSIEYVQKTDVTQLNHDLKLSQIYCQSDEKMRQGWVNETTLVRNWDKYCNEKRDTGSLDAMIVMDGERLGIEVITSSYRKDDIEQKQKTAEKLGCEIKYVRA